MINKFLTFIAVMTVARYRLETILFNEDGEDERFIIDKKVATDKKIEKFKKSISRNFYSGKPLDVFETLMLYQSSKSDTGPQIYCLAYICRDMASDGFFKIMPAKMFFTDSLEIVECMKDNRELFSFNHEATKIDNVRNAAVQLRKLIIPIYEKLTLSQDLNPALTSKAFSNKI